VWFKNTLEGIINANKFLFIISHFQKEMINLTNENAMEYYSLVKKYSDYLDNQGQIAQLWDICAVRINGYIDHIEKINSDIFELATFNEFEELHLTIYSHCVDIQYFIDSVQEMSYYPKELVTKLTTTINTKLMAIYDKISSDGPYSESYNLTNYLDIIAKFMPDQKDKYGSRYLRNFHALNYMKKYRDDFKRFLLHITQIINPLDNIDDIITAIITFHVIELTNPYSKYMFYNELLYHIKKTNINTIWRSISNAVVTAMEKDMYQNILDEIAFYNIIKEKNNIDISSLRQMLSIIPSQI
jgi:hypothetical protein